MVETLTAKQRENLFRDMVLLDMKSKMGAQSPEALAQVAQWVFTHVGPWNETTKDLRSHVEPFKEALQKDFLDKDPVALVWLTCVGTEGYTEASDSVKKTFEKELTTFFGDDGELDTLKTVEEVRDLAYEWGSGPYWLDSTSYQADLNNILHNENVTLEQARGALKVYRERQQEVFGAKGFLNRCLHVPPRDVDDTDQEVTKIFLAGGRRCLEGFKSEKTDGTYLYDKTFGVKVYSIDTETKELVKEAHKWSRAHCDDPVLITATVAHRYIHDSMIDKEAVKSLTFHDMVPLPYKYRSPLRRKTSMQQYRPTRDTTPEASSDKKEAKSKALKRFEKARAALSDLQIILESKPIAASEDENISDPTLIDPPKQEKAKEVNPSIKLILLAAIIFATYKVTRYSLGKTRQWRNGPKKLATDQG